MHPERHPDDLPPPENADLPGVSRPRVPRGVGWAVALAVVTIGILAIVGIDSGGQDEVPDRLDNQLATPAEGGPPRDLEGDSVPDLTFQRFDGSPTSLSDYLGEPLVLNLWASWCPPCLAEMPDFEEVFRERQGTVAFVGLNIADGLEPARRMAEQTGVTYDLVRDEEGGSATALGVTDMPTTVFIDSAGRVVDVRSGAMDADELRERLVNMEDVDTTPPESPEENPE